MRLINADEIKYDHQGAVLKITIDKMPSIITTVETSEWIKYKEDSEIYTICAKCRKCGKDYFKYCPSCGRTMKNAKYC